MSTGPPMSPQVYALSDLRLNEWRNGWLQLESQSEAALLSEERHFHVGLVTEVKMVFRTFLLEFFFAPRLCGIQYPGQRTG